MGIRKHFEKSGDGDLKLQDMTIEAEEREEVFDWEKLEGEITERDKARLVDYLTRYMLWDASKSLVDLSNFKILFPDQMDQFKIDGWARSEIARDIKKGSDRIFSFQLDRGFKILFPEDSGDLDLNNEVFEDLRSNLEGNLADGRMELIYQAAFDLRILFPERFLEIDLEQDRHWWYHEVVRDGLDESRQNGKWKRFVNDASRYRIVFEPEYGEYKISEGDWKAMFDYINKMRKDSDDDFLRYLAGLKILLAERLVIEKNDFEVIMPKTPKEKGSFKQVKKERPERKNF